MTGYGHTSYYLSKKSNFGFQRCAQVLVRLNLFTLLLTYVMDTTYDSYYFTPLISLWYIIIYITLAVGRKYNRNTGLLLGKVFVSMLLVSASMSSPLFIQTTFAFLKDYAKINWSTKESFFRINLDLYIVYAGMLTALAVGRFRTLRLADSHQWELIRRCATGLSIVSLIGYILFELSLPSKYAYNFWHPYVSFIPIVAFVILRNSTSYLRNLYSSTFAFVGRCSLETFIIQFHFWLAGDTKGILLIIPGEHFRVINFMLSSALFIALSHRVSIASTTLTQWICNATADAAKYSELSLNALDDSTFTSQNNIESSGADLPIIYEEKWRPAGYNRVSAACTTFLRSKFGVVVNIPGFWFGSVTGRCLFLVILMWILNFLWTIPVQKV